MTDDTFNRQLTAAAGVLLTIFFVVGLLLPGAPPKADDSLRDVVEFFVDKRDSIEASAFLTGFGGLFLLLFAGGVRRHLRAAGGGKDGLADTSFGGAAAGVALLLAGLAVLNGIAFNGSGLQSIRSEYNIANDLFFVSGFGFALFFGCAAWAGARTGAFPGWVNVLGGLAALLQVLGAIGLFADSGFFAIGGAMGFLAPAVGTVWALSLSVLLFRGAGTAAAA